MDVVTCLHPSLSAPKPYPLSLAGIDLAGRDGRNIVWTGGQNSDPASGRFGAVKLTESEAVDKEGLTLRFWAFDRKKLVQDAPIALAWMGDPRPKASSRFKFEKPD